MLNFKVKILFLFILTQLIFLIFLIYQNNFKFPNNLSIVFIFITIISLLATSLTLTLLKKTFNKLTVLVKNLLDSNYEEIKIEKNDLFKDFKFYINELINNLKNTQEKLKEWGEQFEERVNEKTINLQNVLSELIQTEKLISIGNLTSGVVHEINNPIGIIIPRIEYLIELLEDYNLPEDFSQNLQIIKKQSENIANICRRLLDFSRPTKGEFELLNINDIINETCMLFENQIKKKKINFKQELGYELPLILGDKNKLQQVLLMILNNAKDAINIGGTIEIKSKVKTSLSEYVEVLISDNGSGIKQENINKIFDPFFTTKEVGKGTGLGLSICYGIIKEHNGTMEVISKENEGTTFLLLLPVIGYKGLPERQWDYFSSLH